MALKAKDKLKSGNYTIQKVLGRGRFGITYLARNSNGDGVVIKTLDEDLLYSLGQVKRDKILSKFRNEAKKLKRCKHDHIAQFQDDFQENGRYYIVMEYIAGIDLASRQRSILPQKEALRYIVQIGEALIEVHDHDLVHRDVKPANIMLRFRDGQSEAVLIDFGLVREFDHDLTVTNPEQEAEEGFAPIEMYNSNAQRGAYTDVYSLAATLYNLLTGKVPPDARELSKGISLEPPKTINPKISDRVNDAIMKGLNPLVQARPQTMKEWLNLLGWKPGLIRFPNMSSTTWANWSQVVIVVETALLVWIALFVWIAIIPLLQNPSSLPQQQNGYQQEITK